MFDDKSQKIGNVTSSGDNSGNHIVQNSNSHNHKISLKWIIGAIIAFIISVLGIISSSSDGGFLNHIIFKNNSDNTNIITQDVSDTPKN